MIRIVDDSAVMQFGLVDFAVFVNPVPFAEFLRRCDVLGKSSRQPLVKIGFGQKVQGFFGHSTVKVGSVIKKPEEYGVRFWRYAFAIHSVCFYIGKNVVV